jgi:hypothetical protein
MEVILRLTIRLKCKPWQIVNENLNFNDRDSWAFSIFGTNFTSLLQPLYDHIAGTYNQGGWIPYSLPKQNGATHPSLFFLTSDYKETSMQLNAHSTQLTLTPMSRALLEA